MIIFANLDSKNGVNGIIVYSLWPLRQMIWRNIHCDKCLRPWMILWSDGFEVISQYGFIAYQGRSVIIPDGPGMMCGEIFLNRSKLSWKNISAYFDYKSCPVVISTLSNRAIEGIRNFLIIVSQNFDISKVYLRLCYDVGLDLQDQSYFAEVCPLNVRHHVTMHLRYLKHS